MLTGKGFYIWQIQRCESGNISAIANLATQAGFSHVLLKIADGTSPYNITPAGDDLAARLTLALHERNILALGWHYVYGNEPIAEAEIAIQRILGLGVDGYIIDAEDPYKQPGKDQAAYQFFARLRQDLPAFPFALSSYRYPTLHPDFPWQPFLEGVDYNMPQVYWLSAHNPGDQLVRCVREFQGQMPFRPIIPTGAAFIQGSWQPSSSEIEEFLRVAQNLNLAGANFWEWYNCRYNLPEIWSTIAAYPWAGDASNLGIVDQYIAALNSRNIDRILGLYYPNAALVTAKQTIQGTQAIRQWFQDFFALLPSPALFSLVESSGSLGARHFTWQVSAPALQAGGSDSFGLVEKKIAYHYTQSALAP